MLFLPTITLNVLGEFYHTVMRQGAIESFLLALAFGMVLWLRLKPATPKAFVGAVRLGDGRLPYALSLLVQLALLPGIWAHSSDSAQFFGRFSAGYMLAVLLNLGLIAGFLALSLGYRRWQQLLSREPGRRTLYVTLLLLAGLVFLALPQLRAMERVAANDMCLSALCLLLAGWREWAAGHRDEAVVRLSMIALLATALALLYLAALMIAQQLAFAITPPRHLSAAVFAQVLLGLLWGIVIAQALGPLGARGGGGGGG